MSSLASAPSSSSPASKANANGGPQQINDKTKDVGAPSGHMGGGKPGKAPAARSKTRGGYGVHDYCHHSGSSSRQDYNRRNKNGNQKRFPAAAKGGGGNGRGHQNYLHQPPQRNHHIHH